MQAHNDDRQATRVELSSFVFPVILSMFAARRIFLTGAPLAGYGNQCPQKLTVIASEHSERGNLSVHIFYVAIFQAFTVFKPAEILRFALNDNKNAFPVILTRPT